MLLALGEPDRRVAQVAVDEAAEPARVLRDQGAVEVQALVEGVHRLRRCAAAEDHARRVAREHGRADEDEERRHDQRHEGAEEAPPEECEHGRSLAGLPPRLRHRCHRARTSRVTP
jgi:hypothetical protein